MSQILFFIIYISNIIIYINIIKLDNNINNNKIFDSKYYTNILTNLQNFIYDSLKYQELLHIHLNHIYCNYFHQNQILNYFLY